MNTSDTPITDAFEGDNSTPGNPKTWARHARRLERAANALEEAIVEYMDACPADADTTGRFYGAGLGVETALAQFRRLKP